MIRKLTEQDRKMCMDFTAHKPAENLFIIGDIEAFGFDSDFQDVWGDFDDAGQMRAVLLRYRENYIVFAPEPHGFNALAIAETIQASIKPGDMISGLASVVREVLPHMEREPEKLRETYYAKCEALKDLSVPTSAVRKGTVKDVPRIAALYDQIAEFEQNDNRSEGLRTSMEEGVSRCFYIEKEAHMVSAAMTTAENSMSAMVVGVCTLPGCKKKGYASACMMALCFELLAEGKYLCLFYDNPDAGTIYKKIGFQDIGKWIMAIY